MAENSIVQQLMMSSLEMNSQLMQGMFSTLSTVNNSQNSNGISPLTVTNSLGKLAYAIEGDSKYDEEIDSNNDGIITYNEYVKYVTDNISSKYNIPKNNTIFQYGIDSLTGLNTFTVTNMSKILTNYLNNYLKLPESVIEQKA